MSEENRRPPETEEDVYRLFLELFDDVAPETSEEVDEFLREHGYDPRALAQNAASIFKEALEKSPLHWRNRARREIETAKTKITQREPKAERSRNEIITALSLIQQKRGAAVAAHFRNLQIEKLSDDDLASMLGELEYLENEDADVDE